MSLYVESAPPDRWERSDCAFRSYAFRTALSEGKTRRPTETVLELCFGQAARKTWLRKVDFRFTNPDPKILQTLQEMLQTIQKRTPAMGKGQ